MGVRGTEIRRLGMLLSNEPMLTPTTLLSNVDEPKVYTAKHPGLNPGKLTRLKRSLQNTTNICQDNLSFTLGKEEIA